MGILNKLKFWDNTVNLTAYTASAEIAQNSPPILGKQKAPWFFKTIPSISDIDPISGIKMPQPSVLGCPGIREHLSNGIHIRMWSDLIVKIWPEGKFTYLFPTSSRHSQYSVVTGHHPNQFGKLYPDNRVSIKLENPWQFYTDKSVKFLMTDSHYATPFFRENDLWVPPGISDFNKQPSTNIHIICPLKSEPYEIHFTYGQPLVTFFPLFERNINLKTQVKDMKDIAQLSRLPATFKNKYYKK